MWLCNIQKCDAFVSENTSNHHMYLTITKWSHDNFIQVPERQQSDTQIFVKKLFNVIIISLVYFQDKKWLYCCYHSLFRLLSVTIYYNYLRCLWLWNIRNCASIHFWQPKNNQMRTQLRKKENKEYLLFETVIIFGGLF